MFVLINTDLGELMISTPSLGRHCFKYTEKFIIVISNSLQLRDEIAIGFQKHRLLINKMLKDNPSLLPHIINFLMNSYGEHIGFDLMEEGTAKDSEKKHVEHKTNNNTKCCPHGKTSNTLKILMKRNNITGLTGKIRNR